MFVEKNRRKDGLLRIRCRVCCAPGGEEIKRAAARPREERLKSLTALPWVLAWAAGGGSRGMVGPFEKRALTVDGRPEPGPSERPDERHWPGPPPVAHVG